MSQTKKIQGKIFRGVVDNNDDAPSRSNKDPNIQINIPKPAAPPVSTDKSNGTFRQRILEKLGAEYHSAERYRLLQDDDRSKHWKRWGPYLSERQWVSDRSHSLCLRSRLLSTDRVLAFGRLPFERITLETVMLGAISPTIKLAPVHTDGVRTVSLVFPITTSVFVSRLPFGTRRMISSRNVFSVSPVIKETTVKIARSSTIISIPPRHTLT